MRAKLFFEDGQVVLSRIAARPIVGEFIFYDNDRYRVKDVSLVAVPLDSEEPEIVEVRLGIGRKGTHRHALEGSVRGFFTGSD